VRNLLEFASSCPQEVLSTDINDCIIKVVKLVRYGFKKESAISISTELSSDLPPVAIKEDEFREIMLNLIRNSIDAIGAGGSIKIETSFLPSQSMIQCVVQDTGKGIPESILSRIFDPFFSTKGDQGNTGLGL